MVLQQRVDLSSKRRQWTHARLANHCTADQRAYQAQHCRSGRLHSATAVAAVVLSIATAALHMNDQDILVHCKVGGRSKQACETLAQLGFSRLYNLEGGIIAWAKEVDKSLAIY
eukprot:1182-Heterococcus_DN1.PRE.1